MLTCAQLNDILMPSPSMYSFSYGSPDGLAWTKLVDHSPVKAEDDTKPTAGWDPIEKKYARTGCPLCMFAWLRVSLFFLACVGCVLSRAVSDRGLPTYARTHVPPCGVVLLASTAAASGIDAVGVQLHLRYIIYVRRDAAVAGKSSDVVRSIGRCSTDDFTNWVQMLLVLLYTYFPTTLHRSNLKGMHYTAPHTCMHWFTSLFLVIFMIVCESGQFLTIVKLYTVDIGKRKPGRLSDCVHHGWH